MWVGCGVRGGVLFTTETLLFREERVEVGR